MTEANLVEKIAAFIERFVFIQDKPIYRLLALWVIQTHLYKDFEYVGYVFAHSPEPESGKSRLLEVLDFLVSNSSGLLYHPTESVLFRTAENSTQILDEVDTWTNGECLRGILNAGFRRGGIVKRIDRKTNGAFEPISFPVYAPRAMAGIGLTILHGTTKDRTFIIPMLKQTKAERREKLRSRRAKPEADQIVKSIEVWVTQNRSRVGELYDKAEEEFQFLDHLRDRTIDITEPLAAILEVTYAAEPELESRRIELLEAINLTRRDGDEFLGDHRIVVELARLAEIEDPVVGNASELAARCVLDPKPSEHEVSGTLRRYSFESRSIRQGESVRYRYQLSRSQLCDIYRRLSDRM